MNLNLTAQRLVLLLAGLFIVLTGVNIGYGGMASLGLMGSNAFFTVTDPLAFNVQDSHVRFVGGVWLGIGLIFLAASLWPKRMTTPVLVGCGLIFVGGWSRLSGHDLSLVFGPKLIGSLAAELIGVPVLALWVWRTRNAPAGEPAEAPID